MMEWLEVAKTIPLGQKTRIDCECGDGKTAIVNHGMQNYTLHCFRCSRTEYEWKGKLSLQELTAIRQINEEANKPHPVTLPTDMTLDVPLQGRLWLYSCGISETVWRKYGVGWSDRLRRVILPVYKNNEIVWWQGRSVDSSIKPKYVQPSADRETLMFTSHGDSSVCVVVEDIASAIRVGEIITAHSLLGTSVTTSQLMQLGQYEKVIVWLDSDSAGRNGSYKLRRGLSLITDVIATETELDPKCLTPQQIKEHLEKL